METIIRKYTCIHHGVLTQDLIGSCIIRGKLTLRCRVCHRQSQVTYRTRKQLGLNVLRNTKKQKMKEVLSRITTNHPSIRKALANVVRVIVDSHDPQFKPLGDKNVSIKHSRTTSKSGANTGKSIKR